MGSVLEDLEAFMGYPNVTQLNFWAQHNNIDDLQSQLFGFIVSRDVICNVGDIQRANMGYLRKALEEMMLRNVR